MFRRASPQPQVVEKPNVCGACAESLRMANAVRRGGPIWPNLDPPMDYDSFAEAVATLPATYSREGTITLHDAARDEYLATPRGSS